MIGPSLSLTGVRKVGRSIESFFSGGEQGVYYPLTPGTVYSDVGMTTLASPGDTVGGIIDVVNGQHLTQSVIDRRPLYVVNNGNYGLLFDGVDDILYGEVDLSNTSDFTAISGSDVLNNQTEGGTGPGYIYHHGSGFKNGRHYHLVNNAGQQFNLSRMGPNGTAGSIFLTGDLPASYRHSVLTHSYTASEDTTRGYRNGSLHTAPTGAGSILNLNDTLNMGARYGNTHNLNGTVYGLMIIGRVLTDDERSAAEIVISQGTDGVSL